MDPIFLVQEAKELAEIKDIIIGSIQKWQYDDLYHIGHKMWVWFPVCPL